MIFKTVTPLQSRAEQSRRDGILLTVGFNLRTRYTGHSSHNPAGTTLRKDKVSSLRDLLSNSFVWCCIIVFLLFSCSPKNGNNDYAVAKVGDKYLYFSEMSDIIPKGCSKEDSISLAHLYIDNWIKTRLLLKRAELNLNKEQLNINEEIETYRTSLLIYKYESWLLQEKLDTVVLDSEIQNYYHANIANFSAEEHAVKAVYVKLPANPPTLWRVRQWLTSDSEKDVQDLTDYCRTNAVQFEFFDDEWVKWAIIETELPQKEAATRQLAQNSLIEQRDEEFVYLVRIREKRAPGDTAPLAFVKDKVKSIIINKRKLKYISELEQNIYNEALAKNQFEIFKILK